MGVERSLDDDEANIGEGQIDFTAEETDQADFAQAGIAGTPQAYQRHVLAQKQISTLQKQIAALETHKLNALSKEDIQGMISFSQESAVNDVDGKLTSFQTSLSEITEAYTDLVKIESDRMTVFREAVANLKEAILNTKIPENQRAEMFQRWRE